MLLQELTSPEVLATLSALNYDFFQKEMNLFGYLMRLFPTMYPHMSSQFAFNREDLVARIAAVLGLVLVRLNVMEAQLN